MISEVKKDRTFEVMLTFFILTGSVAVPENTLNLAQKLVYFCYLAQKALDSGKELAVVS